MWMDGSTGRHDKAFFNFANAPKSKAEPEIAEKELMIGTQRNIPRKKLMMEHNVTSHAKS
jgi:hypothetical protein